MWGYCTCLGCRATHALLYWTSYSRQLSMGYQGIRLRGSKYRTGFRDTFDTDIKMESLIEDFVRSQSAIRTLINSHSIAALAHLLGRRAWFQIASLHQLLFLPLWPNKKRWWVDQPLLWIVYSSKDSCVSCRDNCRLFLAPRIGSGSTWS